jgi:hypothetical protein
MLAYLQFELGAVERRDKSKNFGLDSMTKAGKTLDDANKIYLKK